MLQERTDATERINLAKSQLNTQINELNYKMEEIQNNQKMEKLTCADAKARLEAEHKADVKETNEKLISCYANLD